VTRLEWQQLAERRLADAKAMLDARRWDAAYYLAGYAVEFGLKSCILKRVENAPGLIFEDRRFSEKCWTHDLEVLMKLADLESVLRADTAANPAFHDNWTDVTDWNENSRFESVPHYVAKTLYKAITDKQNGVMSWIRVHW
jgi:hypothetical protein